ncbi:MAG: penicillin-binding transpeptidase domain-containing protein, partial [Micrococcales bacterium]|nr:penicillin-binding transpeptidase domain-containing protein [Micrococcales bacterium]
MNTPLRRLATMVLVMFLVLTGGATWVQVFQAQRLNSDPRNARTLYRQFGSARGPIVAGGVAIAQSTPVNDPFRYQRSYLNGPEYSAVTGYFSVVNGSSQLENAMNDTLTGGSDQLFLSRVRDLLTGRSPEGATVETTILPAAQDAAWKALGTQQGAVVAIEPDTGKILALVSTPGFDPNTLATHDTKAAGAAYTKLAATAGNPLRSNATQERFAPGSTFKLVVAAAALANGQYTPDTPVSSPRVLSLPGSTATIANFGGESCGGDTISLTRALEVSCNTAFAQLGMNLGDEAIAAQAKAFGFGDSSLTIPTPVVSSVYPTGLTTAQTAQSAIGQLDVQATPLQMAMVAAGIANGGVVMRPYLVQTVRAADLSVVSTTQPQVYSTAMTQANAAALRDMMVDVVTSGTGTAARIPGVAVAGKTGTAQTTATQAPNAWFTAFAPAQAPRVAVAVFIAHGGSMGNDATGGAVAAPVAKAVIEA